MGVHVHKAHSTLKKIVVLLCRLKIKIYQMSLFFVVDKNLRWPSLQDNILAQDTMGK